MNKYLNLSKGDVLYAMVQKSVDEYGHYAAYICKQIQITSVPDVMYYNDSNKLVEFSFKFIDNRKNFTTNVVVPIEESVDYIELDDDFINAFYMSYDEDTIKQMCRRYTEQSLDCLNKEIENLNKIYQEISNYK